MNRYFYTVESDDSGNKVVHFVGNIYNNGDGEEQNYQIDEWTFLYFDLPELEAAIKGNTLYSQLNDATACSDNMTEAEAEQCCEEYYGGYSGLELHISKVNKDTLFGEYWYEEEDMYLVQEWIFRGVPKNVEKHDQYFHNIEDADEFYSKRERHLKEIAATEKIFPSFVRMLKMKKSFLNSEGWSINSRLKITDISG